VDEASSLPPFVAHQLPRLVGEALTNVYRHARATAVAIQADMADGELRLRVVDNGIGFDSVRANVRGSFGLSGMRERARLINARLTIDSAPGQGTAVAIQWSHLWLVSRIQTFTDNGTDFYGRSRQAESGKVNTDEDGSGCLRAVR